MKLVLLFVVFVGFLLFLDSAVGARSGMTRKFAGSPLQKRNVERRTFLADLLGLSSLKLFALLLIPLFFIIPLMLFLSALLFIPIPILTSPVAGIAAAVGRRYNEEDGIEQIIQELSRSGDCIQRISCEVGRTLDSTDIRTLVDQSLNDLAPLLKDKWKGIIHGYVLGSNGRLSPVNNCGKYACKVGSPEAPVEDWSF